MSRRQDHTETAPIPAILFSWGTYYVIVNVFNVTGWYQCLAKGMASFACDRKTRYWPLGSIIYQNWKLSNAGQHWDNGEFRAKSQPQKLWTFRELTAEVIRHPGLSLVRGWLEHSSVIKLSSSMHKTLCSVQNNKHKLYQMPDGVYFWCCQLKRCLGRETNILVSSQGNVWRRQVLTVTAQTSEFNAEPYYKVYKLLPWKLRFPTCVLVSFM